MNRSSLRFLRAQCVFLALIALLAPTSRSQTKVGDDRAIVEGTVCDSQNKPVADAVISLESDGQAHEIVARSDSQGRYRFAAILPGSYTLRANKPGYRDKSEGPFAVQQKEVKSVALQLSRGECSASAKDAL